MKKIVVFGGGTGLSLLLSGLKLFPVDVTTVIAVSDNGSSTGVLKKELDIPAVGDVGKVLISMANVDEDFTKLLRYRFSKDGSLHNHPVRHILLAALIDLRCVVVVGDRELRAVELYLLLADLCRLHRERAVAVEVSGRGEVNRQ